ncbi:MAG: sulfatase-like hydrolase/transferase [Polyangiaceae bacterium]|nr:sulfatase-like hydrolase/transferase [Polyangiaceae bacterium]
MTRISTRPTRATRTSTRPSSEKGEVGDYDTELAFADQQIRALVETLKARPSLWENTVLVVTADHGEEFGEHGGDRHAVTCYDEVVHVPLFVRVPGVPGQRVEQRVAGRHRADHPRARRPA